MFCYMLFYAALQRLHFFLISVLQTKSYVLFFKLFPWIVWQTSVFGSYLLFEMATEKKPRKTLVYIYFEPLMTNMAISSIT